MENRSLVKNRVLDAQAREIIYSVLQFARREADAKEPIIALAKVQERVAAFTGVSLGTVKNIAKEGREIEDGTRPGFIKPTKRQKKTSTVQLDKFDQGVLRRTIINFHIEEKQVPTIKKIHSKFVSEFEYKGSRESMRLEIKKLGFRWRKTQNNRKLLMEKHEIRSLRLQYLRKIKKFREENRLIVFTDETYLLTDHSSQKNWSDSTNEGLRTPVAKGQRLIIVGAGSEKGFVRGSYLRWKSQSKSGDYHDDMNFENYTKWLQEKLLCNLPQNSVIVLDNASYHNKQEDKAPTSSSRKADMQEWLTARNIPFTSNLLRPELYDIIKLHKPRYVKYAIDKIIRDAGHNVLRLPPYHPDLNPIELVWASLKEYVGARNVDFKFSSLEELTDQFFDTFPNEQWKKITDKVVKIEDEFILKEPLFDEVFEPIIINLAEDSDDEDIFSADSDTDDEDFDSLV